MRDHARCGNEAQSSHVITAQPHASHQTSRKNSKISSIFLFRCWQNPKLNLKFFTGGWMKIPPNISNCLPGLEYLSTLDKLIIKQRVCLTGACSGFEQTYKYVVKNSQGEGVRYTFLNSLPFLSNFNRILFWISRCTGPLKKLTVVRTIVWVRFVHSI